MQFVSFLLSAYSFVLIVAVIITWLPVSRDSPFVQALEAVTEPVLKPIRKLLPDMGGIDISPIIALVLVRLIQAVIVG